MKQSQSTASIRMLPFVMLFDSPTNPQLPHICPELGMFLTTCTCGCFASLGESERGELQNGQDSTKSLNSPLHLSQ